MKSLVFIGQLISLYFFHAVVLWLFDPTLVSALTRYMLIEPAIWGILSTEEMSLLGSHRFPDACEDYSGVVSWLSYSQGIVASIFSSVWISRDLNPIFWFMYAEIGVELLG